MSFPFLKNAQLSAQLWRKMQAVTYRAKLSAVD
jgi:hypothetical protein